MTTRSKQLIPQIKKIIIQHKNTTQITLSSEHTKQNNTFNNQMENVNIAKLVIRNFHCSFFVINPISILYEDINSQKDKIPLPTAITLPVVTPTISTNCSILIFVVFSSIFYPLPHFSRNYLLSKIKQACYTCPYPIIF